MMMMMMINISRKNCAAQNRKFLRAAFGFMYINLTAILITTSAGRCSKYRCTAVGRVTHSSYTKQPLESTYVHFPFKIELWKIEKSHTDVGLVFHLNLLTQSVRINCS